MANKEMNSKVILPSNFTPASSRTNIAASDNIVTAMSKSAKYFNDLQDVAFTGNYANLSGTPTIPTKVSQLTNDSGYTTNTGTVTQVKVGSTAYNPLSGVISLPAYPTDTNTHRPIQLNGTEILGNNTTALNLKAGSNVSMSNNNGTVTISATDTNTTYTFATGDANGQIKVTPSGGTAQNVSVKGLGTAAYTASTAYATNTTLTNQNLNSITTPGFYNAGGGNTVTNKPSGIDNFGLEVIHRASGDYYTQIIYTQGKSYRRYCDNGTWTGWTEDKLTDTNTTYSSGTGISISGTTINHSNSITAGTAKGDDSKTLAFGSTFTVPSVTYDAQGHITGKGTTTMTMPANPVPSGNVTGSSLTADNIALGNGNSTIKSSGKTIATTVTDVDTTVPTSKAVKSFVEGKGYTTNTGTVTGSGLTADNILLGSGGTAIKTGSKTIATSITNVDTTIPTSKAVKTYVDGLVANATHFIGGFNASGDGTIDGGSTTLKSVAEAVGDVYTVTTAGTYLGIAFEIGDSIIFKTAVAAGTAPTANSFISVEGTVSVSNSGPTLSWGNTSIIGTVEGTSLTVKMPANPNTDTKVTSVGNHYTPAEDSSSQLTANASGATAEWNIDVVKGVILKRDAKGHVTGIAVTSGKIPANPNTDRYVNSASFADDTTNSANSPVKMTLTRAGSDSATVTGNIPKVSSASAGVVPKGTTVSSQSQTTKFLREDGTWAAPSYTTNTDTKVTSSANHYAPATVSGQDKTASASGATAAWEIDVVKGVTLNTDGKGHVTGLSVTSGKIPANPNTDTKVTQTADDSTNSNFEVIFSNTADNTTRTETSRKSSKLKFNPSTGNLQATQLNGVIIGSSPKFTDTTYSTVSKTATGLCPQLPNETTTTKYLRQDGTWQVPPDNNTNYYHTTGSWSGLTYTATANGGAGALAFTIPTGTTATTVCVGNDSRLSNARTPTAHNQASNTINAMTSYSKPSSTSAITTSDTLNGAIGKLEKGLDNVNATIGDINTVLEEVL